MRKEPATRGHVLVPFSFSSNGKCRTKHRDQHDPVLITFEDRQSSEHAYFWKVFFSGKNNMDVEDSEGKREESLYPITSPNNPNEEGHTIKKHVYR